MKDTGLNLAHDEYVRPIDANALKEAMYHEAFETDSDMQKWDGGCWIRYKMFEKAIEAAPTINTAGMAPTAAFILGVMSAKLELLRDDINNYCCDEQWVSPKAFETLIGDVETIRDLITGIYAAENAEEVKRGQDSTV